MSAKNRPSDGEGMICLKPFFSDIFAVIKNDTGERIDGVRAGIEKTKIITYDAGIDICPGDVFIRMTSSESEERYRVLHSQLCNTPIRTVPAHYEAEVELIPTSSS